jgi:hypothetical protein
MARRTDSFGPRAPALECAATFCGFGRAFALGVGLVEAAAGAGAGVAAGALCVVLDLSLLVWAPGRAAPLEGPASAAELFAELADAAGTELS